MTENITAKLIKKINGFNGFKPSPMLRAAMIGESSTMLASLTTKQLESDLKGKNSFTMADIREAQRKVFEGK